MEKAEVELDEFGRPYPPKAGKYRVPSITTDALVFRQNEEKMWEILLVTRKGPREKGKRALPGGFVEYNEDPEHGVLRELKEETGLAGRNPTLIGVFGDPLRDIRHIITIAYKIELEDAGQTPQGMDDAEHAAFYLLDEVLEAKDIAFDHSKIIKKAVESLN